MTLSLVAPRSQRHVLELELLEVDLGSGRIAGPLPCRDVGEVVVVALRLADGRAIADDAHYTLVMNNFMATGGDGLALGAEAVRSEPLPIIDLDAFIDYLKQLPQPVRAPTGRRIIEVGT